MRNFDKEVLRDSQRSKYKVYCKCGHSMVIAKEDRSLCSWCNHWCYRTPQIEFRYKTIEKLKKIKN